MFGHKVNTLTRLQKSRAPVDALPEVLERHQGEPLILFKFRDVESLREKAVWLPQKVILRELKQEAALFFAYEKDREDEATIAYPEEGIAVFDKDGESPLLLLMSEEEWAKALSLWNAGSARRRSAKLAHLTHQATQNIGTPQKPIDVVAGARELFNCTSVPANLKTLQEMGEMGHIFKAPTALLSESWENHVAAGAHLHWHLAFMLPGYRDQYGIARRDEAKALEAEKLFAMAASLEERNLEDIQAGDEEDAILSIAAARRALTAAETAVLMSMKESPTTLKLLKAIHLAISLRRKRLAPAALQARRRATMSAKDIEAEFDEEEQLERDDGARIIQGIARTRRYIFGARCAFVV